MESHSVKCVFIGFEDGYKGWKCYDPLARKIIISRDVIFDETLFPGLSTKTGDIPPFEKIDTRSLWPEEDVPKPVEAIEPKAVIAAVKSHLFMLVRL